MMPCIAVAKHVGKYLETSRPGVFLVVRKLAAAVSLRWMSSDPDRQVEQGNRGFVFWSVSGLPTAEPSWGPIHSFGSDRSYAGIGTYGVREDSREVEPFREDQYQYLKISFDQRREGMVSEIIPLRKDFGPIQLSGCQDGKHRVYKLLQD
ncbi:hypothetical protein K2Y11_09855 [bacterium]|nr:hypothetical protein [bacterium]